MARKAASGTGTIRKKTVTRSGKEYTYWEARYTAGINPGNGRQIQRSISGKTQKEVATKLKAATAALDAGTYIAPSRMTVGEWLEIWAKDYLGGVKPRTLESYKVAMRLHLIPAFGAVRLENLTTHAIQRLYNALGAPSADGAGLFPKTVKNIHGVLHKALQQAVGVGYLRFNPSDACILPRIERKEIKPLDDTQVGAFVQAAHGHPMEELFLITLFTGMRQGEILGLQWECVDFDRGTIAVKHQLQQIPGESAYTLVSPKNGKGRVIASAVMSMLRRQRAKQGEMRLLAGECWQDGGFIFTDELGEPRKPHVAYKAFKAVARSINLPEVRFHDLRHSYAVAALRAGDDIKTVQGNLGHATAAFTLDVYGHVTDQMKQESANRMDKFIQAVSI